MITIEAPRISMTDLAKAVETVLFVAESPARLEEIAEAVDANPVDVELALEELGSRLQSTSGLQLVKIAGGYQVCTKREYAETVTRFLKPQRKRLGRSALEVLAIVAYRQPVTSVEIETIRGVQSDHPIRVLMERGMIYEIDRKQAPGRPILYGTTEGFLHQFKLNDLSELPEVGSQLQLEEIG